MKRWKRRDFLRAAGIGSVAAIAPLMPTLGDAQFESTKRLLLITSPNGSNIPYWRPRRSDGARPESGASLDGLSSDVLAPLLERHRDNLILLDGIDMASCYGEDQHALDGSGEGHHANAALFTGRCGANPATRGELFGTEGGAPLYFHNGPSIDQVLAQTLQGDSAFASVQTSRTWTSYLRDEPRFVSSYRQYGERNPYLSLSDSYNQLFMGFESDGSISDQSARLSVRRERSVSALRGEFQRLRATVPAADRVRLDAHVAGLAEVERRMAAVACRVPGQPPRTLEMHEAMALHSELVAQSFACDRTRVMNYELGMETLNGPRHQAFMESLPGWIPTNTDHHGTSHDSQYDADADTNIAVSQRHFAEGVAEILDLLSAPDDSGNSLMDDTVVVWAMPMSHGGLHTSRGTVAVVAQGKNGPFETGRYHHYGSFDYELLPTDSRPDGEVKCGDLSSCHIDYGCAPNNQLLVSLLNAFGVEGDTFGDDRFSGRLRGLDRFVGPWTRG